MATMDDEVRAATGPGPEEPEQPARPQPAALAEGGEAACLLHRVCTECGRMNERAGAVRCEACGAPLPTE
ncbi:hypothetical protein ABT112_32905 [Streptomyces sp. NPDC002055]|uniref:hypothetical protein n=1 Tax=Streptomyces sp. NPDC002055 TaxID=3154534 RepID=UPI0033245505